MHVQNYPLISDQVDYKEVSIIIDTLHDVIKRAVAGDIVEFGCYVGTTSIFISRLLREISSRKAYHVYDSFAGLPDKTAVDTSPAGEQFKAGELSASKTEFIKHFKHAGLPLPVIHKAWFSDLTPAEVPNQICFAFLDGDFYSSIQQSLQLIERQLQPGAVVIVDDYQSEALPGAKRAVDQWLQHHPNYKLQVTASLAVIRC